MQTVLARINSVKALINSIPQNIANMLYHKYSLTLGIHNIVPKGYPFLAFYNVPEEYKYTKLTTQRPKITKSIQCERIGTN